jgi:hypothetical protein
MKKHDELGSSIFKQRHLSFPWKSSATTCPDRPDLLLQVVATLFRGLPPGALQPQLT